MGEHLHNLTMKQFIIVLSVICLVSGIPFSGSGSGDFYGSGDFSGSDSGDFSRSGSGFFSGSGLDDEDPLTRSGSGFFSGSGFDPEDNPELTDLTDLVRGSSGSK